MLFFRRVFQPNRVQSICKACYLHPKSVKSPIVFQFVSSRTLTSTSDIVPNTKSSISTNCNETISNIIETSEVVGHLESIPVSEVIHVAIEQLPALTWYDPTSYVMHGMDLFQNTTGLPWWATLVCTGILYRSVIMLPLNVWLQKCMQEFLPVGAVLNKNNDEIRAASYSLDFPRLQAAQAEKKRLVVKYGFGPGHHNKPAIAIGGSMLLMFTSIGRLIKMPFAPLLTTHFLWVPNLTLPDTFLVMPVVNSILVLVIMKSGADSGVSNPMVNKIFSTPLYFTGFVLAMGYVQSHVSSALLVYWISSNLAGLVTIQLLKNNLFRDRFGLIPRADMVAMQDKYPLYGPKKEDVVAEVKNSTARPEKIIDEAPKPKQGIQPKVKKVRKVLAFIEADEVRKKGME